MISGKPDNISRRFLKGVLIFCVFFFLMFMRKPGWKLGFLALPSVGVLGVIGFY
jgi:hypothetical protein